MEKQRKLVLLDRGFFQPLYRDFLKKLCEENNIEFALIDKEDYDNNPQKYLDEYDYVISDGKYKEGLTTVLHGNSFLEKVNIIDFLLHKIIFYIGHYKKIQQSKKYYPSLQKIIAVSNSIKEEIQRNYHITDEKIIVAHAGFIPPQDKEIEITQRKLLSKDETFVVSMSGVGFIKKGGYVLLRAIRKFKKLYPDVKIKANIIYPKYNTNLAVKLYVLLFGLKKNVEFFAYQKDVFEFYKNSHCFVCPSLLEAFGRVVTEAMYVKRPVIVGSNVGAVDIIKDGENGFIFEADKNRELNLALKIKEVYDKYETLDSLVDKAHDDSLRLTWENFARELFEGLYEKNN